MPYDEEWQTTRISIRHVQDGAYREGVGSVRSVEGRVLSRTIRGRGCEEASAGWADRVCCAGAAEGEPGEGGGEEVKVRLSCDSAAPHGPEARRLRRIRCGAGRPGLAAALRFAVPLRARHRVAKPRLLARWQPHPNNSTVSHAPLRAAARFSSRSRLRLPSPAGLHRDMPFPTRLALHPARLRSPPQRPSTCPTRLDSTSKTRPVSGLSHGSARGLGV